MVASTPVKIKKKTFSSFLAREMCRVASKLEEEEVVSICRERKRIIKLVVDRRHALV